MDFRYNYIDGLIEKRKGEIIEDKERYFKDQYYHSMIQLRINEYREGLLDAIKYFDKE